MKPEAKLRSFARFKLPINLGPKLLIYLEFFTWFVYAGIQFFTCFVHARININGRSWDHEVVFRMEGTRKRHIFHDFSPAEEVAVVNSIVPKKTKQANSF